MFAQGTINLKKQKDHVDALNVFPVPDGDTGTNMSLTMINALDEMRKHDETTVAKVAKNISKGSLMGARGNSGVIMSQIFRGFAKGCEGKETLTSVDFCLALDQARESAYKAVMKPVEGTILTVIRKTAEKAMEYTEEEVPFDELMEVLLKRANETLEKTPEYLDVLKQAGVVDAGGKGLICILEGWQNAMLGKEMDETEIASQSGGPAQAVMNTEDITFQYCTEFILRSEDINGPGLKAKIHEMGDSMVFVQDDDLIKVHVHTDHPGKALEEALKVGELVSVKIENMKEQHSQIIDAHEDSADPSLHVEHDPEHGFIAIGMGEGMTKIFHDLGVGHVIEGGQTMNPSTEDILAAIDTCPSSNIYILPNNSNIILAANQAKELTDKNVYVIPSKTIPQGIAAMVEFDHASEGDENFEAMTEILADINTLQVTYAVRDTQYNDLDIQKDDYLGVANGEIAAAGKDREAVIFDALKKVMDEDSEIVTIYYGEDVTEEEANQLSEAIEEVYDEVDIEVYRGAQPLYYYIISVE